LAVAARAKEVRAILISSIFSALLSIGWPSGLGRCVSPDGVPVNRDPAMGRECLPAAAGEGCRVRNRHWAENFEFP
jgi:hypothetical protein